MSHSLKSKIRQLQRIERLVPQLRQQIVAEATPILREQGLLATPRIERIIQQFGT